MVQFERIVRETLTLGLIPALALSIATGILLSVRAQRRVRLVNGRVQRIMAGDLRERLPTRDSNGPFDKLASGVNKMLDEIETLVKSIASVGNDIAHDLRTPLTRVRICLERGRDNAKTPEELREVINQAIVRLDQSLAVITALLRISEIEHTRRFDAFRKVALVDLLREVHELYEPISEGKNVVMSLEANENLYAYADRDLLFEALANPVDNAVKFTPEGGRVMLSLSRKNADAVIRVADSGPGIADGDTELVMRRFYRSDKSRTEPGFGLGLSLVGAIVKLHGFRIRLSSGPGCIAELLAPLQLALITTLRSGSTLRKSVPANAPPRMKTNATKDIAMGSVRGRELYGGVRFCGQSQGATQPINPPMSS